VSNICWLGEALEHPVRVKAVARARAAASVFFNVKLSFQVSAILVVKQ
jgi:hypothetical protein